MFPDGEQSGRCIPRKIVFRRIYPFSIWPYLALGAVPVAFIPSAGGPAISAGAQEPVAGAGGYGGPQIRVVSRMSPLMVSWSHGLALSAGFVLRVR